MWVIKVFIKDFFGAYLFLVIVHNYNFAFSILVTIIITLCEFSGCAQALPSGGNGFRNAKPDYKARPNQRF